MNESDLIPYSASASVGSGRVLVFAPHPDDEVFGCAGALLRHVEAGDPIRVIIVTDGAWMEGADYAAERRAESRAAAAVLGYGEPEFWNLGDRTLSYGEYLIRRLLASIDEQRAELVYAPSTREIHPDHRALALAAAEAVRRCDRPIHLVMYEVAIAQEPNCLLDLTPLFERKQQAIACFSGQLQRQAYDSHVTALNRYRTYTLPSSVTFAEAYRVVARDALRADPVAALRQATSLAPGWSVASTVGLPLVSVIIRRAAGPGLRETLAAVALQTYPHIEVIIVDAQGPGHSGMPEWTGRFPLQLLSAARPLSRSEAGNLGLDQAAGQYLTWVDEGQHIDPDHIDALVHALRHSATARCAHTGVREAPSARSPAGSSSTETRNNLAAFLDGSRLPLLAVMFDRALVEQGCRFDEDLHALEDYDLLLQVWQHTRSVSSGRVTAARPGCPTGEPDPLTEAAGVDQAVAAAFQKWRTRWEGAQWADIARSWAERLAESERRSRLLQHRLDQASGEADSQRRLLAERDVELQQLKQQMDQASAELERSRCLASDTELSLKRLQQEYSELCVREVSLQQALQALHVSTSWKVTRPLRLFSRLLRGEWR